MKALLAAIRRRLFTAPATGHPLVAALAAAALAGGGCLRALTNPSAPAALPAAHTLVRGQLLVASDFPLAANHRLLEDLTARRADLDELLGLSASDEPIHVYLFESPERFHAFVQLYHPQLPPRRAFFLETDTQLQVYAQWGDSVAEDLRHEVTHGYLHSAVANLPLWLDEGLAEYFETPRGGEGINQSHLRQLREHIRRQDWHPHLPRLESFPPTYDMTEDDYAEAWAWVHFLLHAKPAYRQLLREFLGELRQSGLARPVSARLEELSVQPDQELISYLGYLTAREGG